MDRRLVLRGRETKASFDWDHVTFAMALRQICKAFHLRPQPVPGGGYQLEAAPARREAAARAAGASSAGISVSGIVVREGRTRLFRERPVETVAGGMTVGLQIELDDCDPEMVVGLANVSAMDDAGTVLDSSFSAPSSYAFSSGQYPDAWAATVTFAVPHPRAKKLRWLEGDLLAYKAQRMMRTAINLPLHNAPLRRQAGRLYLVIQDLPPGAGDGSPAFGFGALPPDNAAAGKVASAISFRVRFSWPADTSVSLFEQGDWPGFSLAAGRVGPRAVGSSGASYPPEVIGDASDYPPAPNEQTVILRFKMAEPAVKLVWDWLEKSQPERILSFRLKDVPLPARSRTGPRPPIFDRALEAGHPYYARGGGALLTRIDIDREPAQGGIMELGLSPRTAAGPGPVRWITLLVDPQGEASLRELRPGTYRVWRRCPYPTTRSSGGQRTGRWLHETATVTVRRGSTLVLPPLTWVPDAPVTPRRAGTNTR